MTATNRSKKTRPNMLYINPKFTANSFATHPMYEGKTKERNGKEMKRKESLELEFLSPYIE